MTSKTPEMISHRLAEIVDELAALREGPSSERYQLLTERDSLRSEAASLALAVDEGRSTDSLNAELANLKRRRKSLVGARGGYVTGESADSAGRVGASLTRLRGTSGSSSEIDQLTVRISRIEDVLASRSTEVD